MKLLKERMREAADIGGLHIHSENGEYIIYEGMFAIKLPHRLFSEKDWKFIGGEPNEGSFRYTANKRGAYRGEAHNLAEKFALWTGGLITADVAPFLYDGGITVYRIVRPSCKEPYGIADEQYRLIRDAFRFGKMNAFFGEDRVIFRNMQHDENITAVLGARSLAALCQDYELNTLRSLAA